MITNFKLFENYDVDFKFNIGEIVKKPWHNKVGDDYTLVILYYKIIDRYKDDENNNYKLKGESTYWDEESRIEKITPKELEEYMFQVDIKKYNV